MPVEATIGGHWGDEGKGKFVELRAQNSDLVIRPAGGANAGHNLEVPGFGKVAVHLIPSGITNQDVTNIIGNDVAFNPAKFGEETKDLEGMGISTKKLLVSRNAHLTLPYHIKLEEISEGRSARKGQEIGSTRQGIGPTYTDHVRRIGLSVAQLVGEPHQLKSAARDKFLKALEKPLDIHTREQYPFRRFFSFIPGSIPDEFKLDYYEAQFDGWYDSLKEHVTDTDLVIERALKQDKKIHLEGAQGVLLGIRSGAYDKVTSSGTTVGDLLASAGIPPSYLTETFGIFKAYTTRVGSGGFPTEQFKGNELFDHIFQTGIEVGATTRRLRRIGYFDGVAALYSQRRNNFDHIVIAMADLLKGAGALKIATAYSKYGIETDRFPQSDEELRKCTPIYQEFAPLEEDISGITDYRDLPRSYREYLNAIMQMLPGADLFAIGTGPAREDFIFPQASLRAA